MVKPNALEANFDVLLNIKTIAKTKIRKRLIEANELAAVTSFLLLLIVSATLFSVAFSRIN